MATTNPLGIDLDHYKYGFRDPEKYVFKARKGLDREIVDQISHMKDEPDWMRAFRLHSFEHFIRRPTPAWGAALGHIDFNDIYYYLKPTDGKGHTWDDVPEDIKRTFDRLGIPEAEKKFLAGVGAQYECLSGDARVYTARGLVPIREVRLGDTVFSFDEEANRLVPARVKATAFKGEREVFEVRVGTRTIKATANHPFLVLEYHRAAGKQRGRFRRTWKYLQDLKAGDLVAVAKRLPDIGRPHALLHPLIRTRVVGRNQAVQYPLDISNRYNPVSLPRHRVTAYSTILAQYLERNGLAGGAHTKRIPSWVFTLPQDQMLAFLGGYVDADGYVRDNMQNHDVVLTSGNRPLLQGAQTLAALCGLPTSTIHRFESKHPKDSGRRIVGYRMQVAGDFERIGCRSRQRTARFGRRRFYHDYSSAGGTTFRGHTNDLVGFFGIGSITPAGIEPVYDIEVDGPHNFVAEGLIVHNSESVYHNLKEEWEKLGVIFLDTDSALKQHPDIVREYFGTVVPPEDNKLAALNTAVWSGGSFVYVPAGVKVDIPLQAYFRINAEKAGQFERTMIICEPGSYVHYVEGCLPPGEFVSKGDRWVNIESICPGDTVMDSNGYEAIVKNVRVRPFKGDMLTIRPVSRGNAFQVTPEHPVMAVRRRDVAVRRRPRENWQVEVDTRRLIASEAKFVAAGQLEVGDFLVFPISRVTRENPRYTPAIMRLLGYYLAEGSAYIHNKLRQPVVSFTFNESERDHIGEVKALIEECTGKRPMEVRQALRHGVEVRVYSRDLMDLCVAGCGKGAAEKQLSKTIMELPPVLQAHLLETYFKGDGSVYAKRKHVMMRAATASRQLAWQLQELLARQGHYATISERKGGKDTILGREMTRRDQYVLYYSPDKRQSEVRRGDGYFLVPIKEISRTPYDGPVFNFELTTAPNAYVTRGFAVHNCTAPVYTTDSLHSAVVEIIVKEGARCRYTTIQNWSKNVYNLVTKRAVAYRDATMEWVDGNLGSKLTMKYPSVYMLEPGAKAEILSVAFAGKGQHQDPGAKVIHAAPHTQSSIVSKSIAKDGGRAGYRGLVKVYPGARGSKCAVRCDALILDDHSRSDTYPYMEIDEQDVSITHEATVSKVSDDQLFYLMSRGIKADEAMNMIVRGFIEPIVKELPLEYAVELNRLIAMEMEGSVG